MRKQEYTAYCCELTGEGKGVYVFFKHEDTPEGALYAEEILKSG